MSPCGIPIDWLRTLPLMTNTTVRKCELFQFRGSKSIELMTFPLFPSRMVGQPALHRSNRPRLIRLVDRFKVLHCNWLVKFSPEMTHYSTCPWLVCIKRKEAWLAGSVPHQSGSTKTHFVPIPACFHVCVFNKDIGITNLY